MQVKILEPGKHFLTKKKRQSTKFIKKRAVFCLQKIFFVNNVMCHLVCKLFYTLSYAMCAKLFVKNNVLI